MKKENKNVRRKQHKETVVTRKVTGKERKSNRTKWQNKYRGSKIKKSTRVEKGSKGQKEQKF
jgi:hypothetical protein